MPENKTRRNGNKHAKKKVKMKPKQRVFTCASSPTTGIESKSPHRSTYFADGSYYLISLSFGAVEGGLSGRFVLESMLFAKGFDSTVTRFHAIDRRDDFASERRHKRFLAAGLWVMLAPFV